METFSVTLQQHNTLYEFPAWSERNDEVLCLIMQYDGFQKFDIRSR